MYLILSSLYISEDMQLELGKLPPCMLPIGGKRLLEWQLCSIEKEQIYLTLPDTYKLSISEVRLIEERKVEVIWLKDNLPLGKALAISLCKMNKQGDVTILFGDTLIKNPMVGRSKIGITNAVGYYEWSVYQEENNQFLYNDFEYDSNLIFNGIVNIPNKICMKIIISIIIRCFF